MQNRIVIIDDHKIFGEGFCSLLEANGFIVKRVFQDPILALNYFEKNNNFDKINQLFIDVPFFRALISNSMMSLKKSFFELTFYLKDDKEFSEFWNLIHDEYDLTKKMLLKVSGFKKLMQDEPANMASIETREKIILPLFTIQQYAIQSINKLSKSSIEDLKKVKVYEKIITRSLFGNINASRNSA